MHDENLFKAHGYRFEIIEIKNYRLAREEINHLLLREDVQKALKAQEINPFEAKKRIDSLSDAEVVCIADRIDKLPAGGGGFLSGNISPSPPLLPIIIAIIIVVLLIAGIVYVAKVQRQTNDFI